NGTFRSQVQNPGADSQLGHNCRDTCPPQAALARPRREQSRLRLQRARVSWWKTPPTKSKRRAGGGLGEERFGEVLVPVHRPRRAATDLMRQHGKRSTRRE